MANDEAAVERYLDSEIRKLGGFTRKIQYIGRRGCPDRLVVFKGLHLVELKRPRGGRLSVQQTEEYKELVKQGASAAILWGKVEVDNWLAEILD